MSELDDEFENLLRVIEAGKLNLKDDEQNIVDAWVAKLSEPVDTDELKQLRNEYAQTLGRLINEEKQLLPPFSSNPPSGQLVPLTQLKATAAPAKEDTGGGGVATESEAETTGEEGGGAEPAAKPSEAKAAAGGAGGGGRKYSFPLSKLPCQKSKDPRATGAIPKTKRLDRTVPFFESVNDFEDPEEMARVIAKSKGTTFAEFVVAICRHTRDFGQELRSAMKIECASFKDYVDRVLTQRIKDLTEVLDDEQNAELQRIKKDIEKWQQELSLCKKRIKEIIPDFDLEKYKQDEAYLRKIFAFEGGLSGSLEDDSFTKWREETCHRLKWYSDMICKLTKCNEGLVREIENIKSEGCDYEAREILKQQNHARYMKFEMAEYNKLRFDRDQMYKENDEILAEIEEF